MDTAYQTNTFFIYLIDEESTVFKYSKSPLDQNDCLIMPRLLRRNRGSNPASNDGTSGNVSNEAAAAVSEAAGRVDGGTGSAAAPSAASVDAASDGTRGNVASNATPASARGRKRKKSGAADGENEVGRRWVSFDVLMSCC